MEKLAYLKIEDNFTPHDAADMLEEAKKQGFGEVIVLHSDNAAIRRSAYREKLLGVFRAAYRHKAQLYIADDSFKYSGTAFGELSTVKDMLLKCLVKMKKSEATDKKIIAERGDECIVAEYFTKEGQYPFGHYVDLTNPQAAQMVIESVYAPLCREYEKFVGYEFKGFACISPLYNIPDRVIYSPFVLEQSENVDCFKLMEKGDEYEKYMGSVCKAMEENYILPLKNFCREKGLDFVLCGGKNSVRGEFLKANSKYNLSYGFKGEYLMECDSVKKAVLSGVKSIGAVVPISLVMKAVESRNAFLKKLPADCTMVQLDDLDKAEDEFLITNLTDKEKTICLILDDYVITDPESGEVYPLLKTQYTFYPYSYLYVKKKTEDMYLEFVPPCVGGVLVGEFCDECEIAFEKQGDVNTFFLPDINLSNRFVEFIGDFEFLKVRLGSMEHELVQKPFIAPLYDFLREARGGAQAIGGEIEKIVIKRPAN